MDCTVCLRCVSSLCSALISAAGAVHYDDWFPLRGHARVIAHRAGGNLANENTLKALDAAVSHGAYGAEIRPDPSVYRANIDRIHAAGKSAGVWTVNTSASMNSFLNSDADFIITD